MTSTGQQRIKRSEAAIANQPVDRPPRYVPAIACDVASEILGRPAHTGAGSLHYAEVAAWADGPQAHAEFEAKHFQDLIDIHRALDVDVIRIPWRWNACPDKRIDEYTFLFGDPDGEHYVTRYNPDSGDFGVISNQHAHASPEESRRAELDRLEAEPFDAAEFGRRSIAGVRQLWEMVGDEFFVIGAGAGITAGIGAENMLLLALEPDLIRRQVMYQARSTVAIGLALVDSPMPAVILGGGDLAGTDGPMYSPKMFHDVVLPGYVWAIERLNPAGAHYVFRSDGNLWPLMDMLFGSGEGEAHCPGYGEVDHAATMTMGAIRERFADLVIWGNVSSATMFHGTPQQVIDECKQIQDESGGHGYFHGCSNALVKGTPIANVEALFSV